MFFLSMYQGNGPQRGVGLMPKKDMKFMECEVMRFYRLQVKGIVEPLSMTVPRKVCGCGLCPCHPQWLLVVCVVLACVVGHVPG